MFPLHAALHADRARRERLAEAGAARQRAALAVALAGRGAAHAVLAEGARAVESARRTTPRSSCPWRRLRRPRPLKTSRRPLRCPSKKPRRRHPRRRSKRRPSPRCRCRPTRRRRSQRGRAGSFRTRRARGRSPPRARARTELATQVSRSPPATIAQEGTGASPSVRTSGAASPARSRRPWPSSRRRPRAGGAAGAGAWRRSGPP